MRIRGVGRIDTDQAARAGKEAGTPVETHMAPKRTLADLRKGICQGRFARAVGADDENE